MVEKGPGDHLGRDTEFSLFFQLTNETMIVHLVRNSKCYLIAPRSGEGARVSVESGGVLWQETDGGNGGHCQKHIRILWRKVTEKITLAMPP